MLFSVRLTHITVLLLFDLPRLLCCFCSTDLDYCVVFCSTDLEYCVVFCSTDLDYCVASVRLTQITVVRLSIGSVCFLNTCIEL